MASREWMGLRPEVVSTIARHQNDAPVKLSALAKDLGLKVMSSELPSGISGEIGPNRAGDSDYVIRVNANDSSRRQRFTVAHEIAHFLLHRHLIGNGISDDVLYRSGLSNSIEAQANRLAADILMPQPLVDEWLQRATKLPVDDIVGYLSDTFKVSEAAMKIRLGVP